MAELAALVDAVKERVKAQYPENTSNGPAGVISVGLPDLTPLARARDALLGKMAAIGTVNPRPGGLMNNCVQGAKRIVARSLNWFVRDQVVFNRQVVTCIETCLETLADVNRTIHLLAGQSNTQVQQVRAEAEPLRSEARVLRAKTSELQDLSSHWFRWREEWQLKLHKNEVEFLKSTADLSSFVQKKVLYLEAAFQQRVSGVEQNAQELHKAYERRAEELASNYEQRLAGMHAAFTRSVTDLQVAYDQRCRELDASYSRTALEIEAACQGAIVPLQASFEQKVADVISQFDGRVTQFERDIARSLGSQHHAFEQLAREQIQALDQRFTAALNQLQTRFYQDLDRVRVEYEQVIHAELRVVRQRLAAGVPVPQTPKPVEEPASLPFDYGRFAERFRGSEEYVTQSQRFYLPYFAGRRRVLDVGCGRGEFLKLMQEAGVPAKGIEMSEESVAYCRSLGLDVEHSDLFAYVSEQAEGSLDGILCSQVVEHLPADRLPEVVRLCASRLATGGILAIETPDPACLAIFATHFYLDPTHTRPVPSQLLAFYMEEFGIGGIEVHPRVPVIETFPEIGELPEGFRKKFFDGQDYAIIGYKL